MNEIMDDESDVAEAPHDEIARLEARIEELADAIERCRKFDAASKVVMIGGALWFFAGLFGLVNLDGTALAGSIAAVLGGIVLNGSNGSTMQQTRAALDAAEARRAELIGALDMRTVETDLTGPSPGRWLH